MSIILIWRERRWSQKCQSKQSAFLSLSLVYQQLLLEQRQFLFETEVLRDFHWAVISAAAKLISFHSYVGKCLGHILMSRLDRWRGKFGARERQRLGSFLICFFSSQFYSPSFQEACDQNTLIAVGVFVLFMLLLYIVRTPHTFVLCLMSIWDYYAKSYPGRFDLHAN